MGVGAAGDAAGALKNRVNSPGESFASGGGATLGTSGLGSPIGATGAWNI
jgi:hypothetical protein